MYLNNRLLFYAKLSHTLEIKSILLSCATLNKIKGSSNNFEALVFKFFVVSNCLIIIGKYICVY